jgi:hypothetical protein
MAQAQQDTPSVEDVEKFIKDLEAEIKRMESSYGGDFEISAKRYKLRQARLYLKSLQQGK